MRIVILGAGQVGGTLAAHLAGESNDITLVDIDAARLKELQQQLDIRTIHGLGSYPTVLEEAGIRQADLLIAVTRSDEVNMVACEVAHSLFQTPMKIARIRSRHYYGYPGLFQEDNLSIDFCISPETLVTEHIANLIEFPNATQVLDFAEGKLLIISVKIKETAPLLRETLKALHQQLGHLPFLVLAIFRDDTLLEASGSLVLQANDLLVFSAASASVPIILKALTGTVSPNRRIMIAGGGHIGAALAQSLEKKYRVKIIEQNYARAEELASQLSETAILHGDIADRELLISEDIAFMDVFCAVTNDDEANIMSCLQAKSLGVDHVMTLVNRSAYVELIEDSSIDQAISPQLITISGILTKLGDGHLVRIHRLHHHEAEAIELIMHGNEQNAPKALYCACKDLLLPPGWKVAAVIRGEDLFIAPSDLSLEPEDHVILFLLNRKCIDQIEALFQVNLRFMSQSTWK